VEDLEIVLFVMVPAVVLSACFYRVVIEITERGKRDRGTPMLTSLQESLLPQHLCFQLMVQLELEVVGMMEMVEVLAAAIGPGGMPAGGVMEQLS
jgi:hypothetical protein